MYSSQNSMTGQRKWILLVSVLLFVALVPIALLMFQPDLDTIHKLLESDYQSVTHISAADFSSLERDEVVVFDVREPEEFQVSHIVGAIQLMPNIGPIEFFEEYGDLLKDKKIVFYCSVGRRSSELASRLGDAPFEYGAESSKNLIGGVFSWVNQGRQLSSSSQTVTRRVHPYNSYWGRLVEDSARLSYQSE
jgi:rhodanese-related sulfurtransferase